MREFLGFAADFSQGIDLESFRHGLEDIGLIEMDDEAG